MTTTTTGPTILARIAAVALLAFGLTAHAQVAHKWQSGDIFLSGTNSTGSVFGKFVVFHPGCACFIDTLTDTNGASPRFTPGPNNASAIDNTWHLVGTDSGQNSTSSFIVKFRIAPNDTSNPTTPVPLTQVVSDFSSAQEGTVTSVNPQSLVIDAAGNYLVANASPAAIFKFSPSGTAITSFPFPITFDRRFIDNQIAGIDINQTESVLYYTSAGTTIRAIQLATGSISTVAMFSQTSMFDVRFIPHAWLPSGATACGGVACPSGDALLVAAQGAVLLVNASTGALVHAYTISGNTNLQSLALDPMVRDSRGRPIALPGFWTAGPTSSNFYHVQLSNGSTTTYGAGSQGFTGVLSIATYPGFNANQSAPNKYTDQTMTAAAGSVFTNDANYFFSVGNTTDQLTLTAYANPNFASSFTTTPVVFASAVQPSGAVTDDGFPCLQTLSGNLCTVWQADIPDPGLPSNALMALKIATVGATPPQGTDANTRGYRNEWNDVTDKIDTGLWSKLSVYDLVKVPGQAQGATGANCVYYPPVNTDFPNSNTGGTLNNPGNVTFRFTCTGISTTELASLLPYLSVVELGTGGAPEPYFPAFTSLTGGTCCTQANYRFDTSTNTWVLNVSFQNLPSANVMFTATTYDASHQVAGFDITFTILNGNQNLK